jgi:hypothetical protein
LPALVRHVSAASLEPTPTGEPPKRGPPLMVPPLAKAVGFYRGKRRTIPLDGCSLCGLDGIGSDIALLMPGAQW